MKLRNHIKCLIAAITCFQSSNMLSAGPIQCGEPLSLVRTLQFPGLQIGGVEWHQGQLWTVDQSGVLRRIDPVTGAILETSPTGMITHNGLGSNGSTLYMSYDPGGTFFKSVLPPPPGNPIPTPTPAARDMTAQGGSLWYADFNQGKIVKMTKGGGFLAEFPSPAGFGASGIAWDGAHLLHTRHDGNLLYLLNPSDGTEACPLPLDMSSFNPTIAGGLAWDPNSMQLYAADFDKIYVIPEPGSAMLFIVALAGLLRAKRKKA